jgi:hypothetical protein
MNRRDDWIAQERLVNTTPPGESARVKRCWVMEEGGRQPGLLLEWRRTGGGWQGALPTQSGTDRAGSLSSTGSVPSCSRPPNRDRLCKLNRILMPIQRACQFSLRR